VNYIPIEEMRDRYLVGVVRNSYIIIDPGADFLQCNLKPANMRGVKSFAMVLCVRVHSVLCGATVLNRFPFLQASSKDGKEGGIELVKPPDNSKIGDKIYFEGPEYESERAWSCIHHIRNLMHVFLF
jgi:aminoacyl tRNA synthase complex-interacting multifunctional protein 1